MAHRIIQITVIAAALLLSASPSLASDKKPEAPGASAGSAEKGAKAQKPAAPAKNKAAAAAPAKLVDINSAGKAELMKLPGIGNAEADKIIAGRPYLSKARLATQNIIDREVYEKLKTQVVARQK